MANVANISLPHPLCIQFDLQLPDYWLAHRLAELPCLMTHPELPAIGAGPFKLTLNEPQLVRLEQHAGYHLQHPYLDTIEYWITPICPPPAPTPAASIRCASPSVSKTIWRRPGRYSAA